MSVYDYLFVFLQPQILQYCFDLLLSYSIRYHYVHFICMILLRFVDRMLNDLFTLGVCCLGDPATTQKLLTPKSESTATSQMQPPDTAYFATPENINNNIYNSSSGGGAGSGGGGSSGGASTSTMPSGAGSTSAPPPPPPPSGRQPVRKRVRRRTMSTSQDPAEQLTEMSVRGLNLFRYASVNEGVYQCTECAKVDVQKTFKNKYSFQRHAFLYHEGHQRKVFPCPVCAKEFSRPDKMKNHMKTVHDCFMPKDCVFPMGFFLPP